MIAQVPTASSRWSQVGSCGGHRQQHAARVESTGYSVRVHTVRITELTAAQAAEPEAHLHAVGDVHGHWGGRAVVDKHAGVHHLEHTGLGLALLGVQDRAPTPRPCDGVEVDVVLQVRRAAAAAAAAAQSEDGAVLVLIHGSGSTAVLQVVQAGPLGSANFTV